MPQKTKILSALAYVVFVIPVIAKEHRHDFVRFHIRQSIGLVIAVLAIQGIISILWWWQFTYALTFLGAPRLLLVWALRIYWIGMMALGAYRAWSGEKKELPFIGKYAVKL